MMYSIVKNIIDLDKISMVMDYCKTAKFNTKEDHIPLHDPLFSNPNVNFDLITYGDLNKEIVDEFIKICNKIKEETSRITSIEYDEPILGKSYIARFSPTTNPLQGYDSLRPNKTYTSIFVWGDKYEGADFIINNNIYKLSSGDCLILPESSEYARNVTQLISGNMFISQFWNAPHGISPYPGLKYEDIYWGNPLYDKIG